MSERGRNLDDEVEWAGLLRALTYAIILSPDPLADVDRAIEASVGDGALGATRDEYLGAITRGLASDKDLGALLDQEKPDAVIRQFLRAAEARLRAT